jgi:hypothetical protein
MKDEELEAIRERDASLNNFPNESYLLPSEKDRRALLRYVDELRGGFMFIEQAAIIRNQRAELAALREAAGKVTCERCNGDCEISETYPLTREVSRVPCPDCADLRKILGEKHE